ncbi:MAG: hypothetical protein ACK4HV_00210 [Parachlamydiaceae bacterium]
MKVDPNSRPLAPQVHEKNNFAKIIPIGIKILSGLAIVSGTFFAIGGAVMLTKSAVALTLFAPLFTGGIALSILFLYLSAALILNKYTRYGLILTLPAAGLSAGFPYLIPALIGSMPGAGLVTLGIIGFKKNS